MIEIKFRRIGSDVTWNDIRPSIRVEKANKPELLLSGRKLRGVIRAILPDLDLFAYEVSYKIEGQDANYYLRSF